MTSDLDREMGEVWEECRKPDWDGYNALPMSRLSWENAKHLASFLPPGTEVPSVGAVPSGNISLEWYSSPRWALSVTMDRIGNVHYAALLGPANACGIAHFCKFCDKIPQRILELIAEVNGKEETRRDG
jgi:hypothetical protein